MPDEREWVVMLRARSTIRLRDDPHVVINPDSSSTGPVLGVRIRNTFAKITDDRLVVTGLFVEARGMAAGPDSAVEQLAGRALPHFQVIATAGNGAVDEPVDLVVYAPPVGEHPGRFLERRSCGPKDPAAVVRSIDAADLLTVLNGLNGAAISRWLRATGERSTWGPGAYSTEGQRKTTLRTSPSLLDRQAVTAS